MRRFLVWVSGLTALFALLIVTIEAISGAYPPPALAALHLTDCQLPCWLGITPGQTTLDQAVYRIQTAYPQATLNVNRSAASFVVRGNSTRLAINVFADSRAVVSDLLLYTYDFDGLALGDVVSLLKKPFHLFGAPPLIAVPICPSYLIGVSGSTVGDGWQRSLAVLEIQDTNGNTPCA